MSSSTTTNPSPLGITVFCGASPGNSPLFTAAAESLAVALAKEEGIETIYGGGTSGIMGLVAKTVLKNGGKVHGIIPGAFLSAEAPDRKITNPNERETIVASMHERKKLMADLSQAFVALPGGFGTLEEASEMTTWSQLGIHKKPVVLLNVSGFYSPLRDFIENAISSGFISEKNRAFLTFVDGPPSTSPEAATFDWGRAALDAIRDWQEKGSGGAVAYSFEWQGKGEGMGKEVR